MGREPVTRKPKLGLQQLFEERTLSIYGGMRTRFGPKRNKDGKVVDPGRKLPFELWQFRGWMMERFAGNHDSVISCSYCASVWLSIQTVVVDHCIPVANPWNGSLELSNLVCCCKDCNVRKGKMSGDDWMLVVALCAGVLFFEDGRPARLDPRSVNDMLGRMANGAAYMRLMLQNNRNRMKVIPPGQTTGLFDAPEVALSGADLERAMKKNWR